MFTLLSVSRENDGCGCHGCNELFTCKFFFSSGSESDTVVDVAGDGDTADGMVPTSKRKKLVRGDTLTKCLSSGEYPEFTGFTGVVDELHPLSTECLDFVKVFRLTLYVSTLLLRLTCMPGKAILVEGRYLQG